MKKARIKILAVIAVVALFGLVSQMDYEDAVSHGAHYCAMVESGVWPAYRDDIFCSKVEGK